MKKKNIFSQDTFVFVRLLVNHAEALDSVRTMSRGDFVISEKGESA